MLYEYGPWSQPSLYRIPLHLTIIRLWNEDQIPVRPMSRMLEYIRSRTCYVIITRYRLCLVRGFTTNVRYTVICDRIYTLFLTLFGKLYLKIMQKESEMYMKTKVSFLHVVLFVHFINLHMHYINIYIIIYWSHNWRVSRPIQLSSIV